MYRKLASLALGALAMVAAAQSFAALDEAE
jgi:hypothetical protein